MEFDAQLRRIVEAKLWARGRLRIEYPAAHVSAVYHNPGGLRERRDPTSDQERWIMRHHREILEAAQIDAAVRLLPLTERRLVELRYFEDRPWRAVARALNCSVAAAFVIRDRALILIARELGLLQPAMVEDAGGTRKP